MENGEAGMRELVLHGANQDNSSANFNSICRYSAQLEIVWTGQEISHELFPSCWTKDFCGAVEKAISPCFFSNPFALDNALVGD
jgi:hypothetical protein